MSRSASGLYDPSDQYTQSISSLVCMAFIPNRRVSGEAFGRGDVIGAPAAAKVGVAAAAAIPASSVRREMLVPREALP